MKAKAIMANICNRPYYFRICATDGTWCWTPTKTAAMSFKDKAREKECMERYRLKEHHPDAEIVTIETLAEVMPG